jgi:methylated-DNA-[protein]-cysteine S-methyltransferase
MQQQDSSYDIVCDSPVGKLGIRVHGNQLTRLDYQPDSRRLKPAATGFGRRVCSELAAYFEDPAYRFTLPVAVHGTDFQQRVWQQLIRIAPGTVRTYGELAARLDSGARAVGNACRHNPVSIIVPCHRVVGAGGLGGYSGKTAGSGLERKRWLLQHEGAVIPALKSA